MNITIINTKPIEEFAGPILDQVEDSNGQIYIRKWCGVNHSKSEQTFILCKTTTARIKSYKNKNITLYALMFDFNHKVILEKKSNNVEYHEILVKDLDPNFLPKKDAMYDESLAPENQ